jgi:hypothetical protein
MADEADEQEQGDREDDDEAINDPLTHSDEEAPRMPFGSDPESEESA